MATEKNIAAFLDDQAYTIRVGFQVTDKGQNAYAPTKVVGGKTVDDIFDDILDDVEQAGYIYVTNIKGIKPGDFVVVPTQPQAGYQERKVVPLPLTPDSVNADNSSGEDITESTYTFTDRLRVARVLSVDTDVTIEPNSNTQFKWVVSTIDLVPYAQLMVRNDKLASTIQSAYKKSLRRSFADRVLAELDDSGQNELRKLLGK